MHANDLWINPKVKPQISTLGTGFIMAAESVITPNSDASTRGSVHVECSEKAGIGRQPSVLHSDKDRYIWCLHVDVSYNVVGSEPAILAPSSANDETMMLSSMRQA